MGKGSGMGLSGATLRGKAVTFGCLLLVASQAGAEPLERRSDDWLRAEAGRYLGELSQGSTANACKAEPVLSELARRDPAAEGFAALEKSLCALNHNDGPAVLAALAKFEARADQQADLRRYGPLGDVLGIYGAAIARDADAFVTHSVHIALRDNPREFAALDVRAMQFTFWKASEDQRNRVSTAFASMGSFSALKPDLRRTFAMTAVRPAIEAGDLPFASRLALSVGEPWSVVRMLVDRRYEAVWPALEQQFGPHLMTGLAVAADEEAARANANPDDVAGFHRAMWAANKAGRYAVTAGFAARLGLDKLDLGRIDEPHAWAINYYVEALDNLGRRAEADRLFDRLAGVPASDRSWMVNFVINRAGRLIDQGRWAEALPAAQLAAKVAAQHGSRYARQDIAVARVCAAARLGQDVSAEWAVLLTQAQDDVGSTAAAAMCIGRLDDAKRVLLAALADEKQRPEALVVLQAAGLNRFKSSLTIDPAPASLLATAPDLRAAVEKYGRILPDALVPEPDVPEPNKP